MWLGEERVEGDGRANKKLKKQEEKKYREESCQFLILLLISSVYSHIQELQSDSQIATWVMLTASLLVHVACTIELIVSLLVLWTQNHGTLYDDLTWSSSGKVFTITKVLVDNVHTNSLHHSLCARVHVCMCACACVRVCACVHCVWRGREEEKKIVSFPERG